MFLFGDSAVIVFSLSWFWFTSKVDIFALVPIPAGSALERADDSAASWIYIPSTKALWLPFSLLTTVFSYFLTAEWDRTVSFCWWIFILGCLSHLHDGRWYMGWSRDSALRGKLFWNVHPRDQQSAASPWRNDLPRVWYYWLQPACAGSRAWASLC